MTFKLRHDVALLVGLVGYAVGYSTCTVWVAAVAICFWIYGVVR